MQFSSLFFSLVLATAVVAKGDKNSTSTGTKAVTDKSMCKEMSSLNQLVKLASNETKLADKTKNNATKIADIQAKASDASTKLTTMSSNTTLMSTCAVIDAAAKTDDECQSMKSLQKLVSLAGNDTALADKAKNNQTKIDAIKGLATKAQTKLDAMTSNSTLTTACDSIKSSKASKNGTKDAAASASAAGASASSTAKAKSAASMLNARVGLLSSFVLVAAGMMML
ncbi:hypothetical protein LCER1_G002117 [Lachnellula cervina]|uniref:Cell wall mannoprotein 1 n=1 Tax=Lachnellula cervina TaxID=1316786 RepID=A0A7D8UTU9_9HELO|nr:hypothetical protein LCER1_G002117 [Lachnellula cervina]